MKNILFSLLLITTVGKPITLLAQNCPNSYTRSPVQAQLYFLSGGQVTDVVNPGQIYYLKIKPIDAVMSLYPNKRAVNIGVKIAGYSSATSGFTLYNQNDTNAQTPFSDSVVQSGVGPDVGADQTAVFVIKINSDNNTGSIVFNGGYYMCVNYYDSNNLPVYQIMAPKPLTAP